MFVAYDIVDDDDGLIDDVINGEDPALELSFGADDDDGDILVAEDEVDVLNLGDELSNEFERKRLICLI